MKGRSKSLWVGEAALTVAVMVLSACMSCVMAAVVDTEPDAWGDEQMGGPDVVHGEAGLVTVSFSAQSTSAPPQFTAAVLMANASVSGGAFIGDYLREGVRGVHFRVSNTQPACYVELILQGADSGRLWRNSNVQMATAEGGWETNTVSFDRSAGWTRDGGGNVDAMWTQDLQNVAMVGVRVSQRGFDAQTCSVEQFMLKDSSGFVTAAAELTDLQGALLDRFSVSTLESLTPEQVAADADGDGMSDVNELLAGTNPDNASSVFAAGIMEDDTVVDGGITVSWPCVIGARYTVLRCTNLMEGMQNLAVGLVATETGVMTYHDTTAAGEGTYFYRVRRD